MDLAPILAAAGPFLGDVHHGQIEHFKQTVIGGEYGFCLGHLSQLPVEVLNGIGGIDQCSDFLGILEIGGQVGPVGTLGDGDSRIFAAPFLIKGIEFIESGLLIQGGIDFFEVRHEFFDVLVGDGFGIVTDLVDDALLDFGFGIYCLPPAAQKGNKVEVGISNG